MLENGGKMLERGNGMCSAGKICAIRVNYCRLMLPTHLELYRFYVIIIYSLLNKHSEKTFQGWDKNKI